MDVGHCQHGVDGDLFIFFKLDPTLHFSTFNSCRFNEVCGELPSCQRTVLLISKSYDFYWKRTQIVRAFDFDHGLQLRVEASSANIHKNMLTQQNGMFSWHLKALVMVPYFAEQCDDWTERHTIFGRRKSQLTGKKRQSVLPTGSRGH